MLGLKPDSKHRAIRVGGDSAHEPLTMRHVELAGHDDQAAWLFVRVLALAVLIGIVTVAAFNWYVDPSGVTGRETRWRVVAETGVRDQKIDLLEAYDEPPDAIIYGSSRSMMLDPGYIRERTGSHAFNAATSASVPRDVAPYVAYAARRWPGDEFPHVVWGIEADSFRPVPPLTGSDPRLASQGLRERIRTLAAAGRALTEWQTTRTALQAVRARGMAWPATEMPAGASSTAAFGDDGFQLTWSFSVPSADQPLARLIDDQMDLYEATILPSVSPDLDPEALHAFERAIRTANEQGDVPTIWVTPFHPDARERLTNRGLPTVTTRVMRYLREVRTGDAPLRFELVDLSRLESFGGQPDDFYDGVHMMPDNLRRVAAELERQGAFERGH